MSTTIVPTPTSHCRFGFARRDITPPAGIYHRCWGAATHDRATGVHRPIHADVIALAPLGGEMDQARLQVLLDLGWLRRPELQPLRDAISEVTGLPLAQVLVGCNHSHSVANVTRDRLHEPGGELILSYLEELRATLTDGARAALANLRPVFITYGWGRCALAANRDYWDAENARFVCGYNPGAPADDTVMVATVTASPEGGGASPPNPAPMEAPAQGPRVASLVNYACHPTTLAWENTVISPDYIGACREVVEQAIGAPCVFLLGACGELGPREGYVGDPAVADRNGRQLGYAALSAMATLGPPATDFTYTGPVVSGATLGTWAYRPATDERRREIANFTGGAYELPLPLIPLPAHEVVVARREERRQRESAALAAGEPERAREFRALAERDTRLLGRIASLSPGDTYPLPASAWRVGEAVWVTIGSEIYSAFQTTLRARFPGVPILVTPLTNDSDASYLPPRELYGRGIYQEEIAILAPGCLEAVTEKTARRIEALLRDAPSAGG
jgi:hypothetical protein